MQPTSWRSLFTLPFLAVSLFYFNVGFMGSSVLVTYILKDVYHFSPARMDVLSMVRTSFWSIKPLYGFLSDRLPCCGLHHKPYIYFGVGIFSVTFLFAAIADPEGTPRDTIFAMVSLAALALAVADTVFDGIVARYTKTESADQNGTYLSTVWMIRFMAGVLSGIYAAVTLTVMSARMAFGISAVLPVLCIIALSWYHEAPRDDEERERGQPSLLVLARLMCVYEVWYPVLFIVVLGAIPSYGTALFYYLSAQYSQSEVAASITAGSIGPVVGSALYAKWLRQCETRKVVGLTLLVSMLLSGLVLMLVTDVIPDRWLRLVAASAIFFVLDMVSTIIMMPLLVYFAGETADGLESTMYSTAISLANASGIISKGLSASMMTALGITSTSFKELPLMIVVCSCLYVVPLWMVVGLPVKVPQTHSAVAQFSDNEEKDADDAEQDAEDRAVAVDALDNEDNELVVEMSALESRRIAKLGVDGANKLV